MIASSPYQIVERCPRLAPCDGGARDPAGLESVIGPFYLAITVARLVTMELDDRRRGRQ